MLCFSIFCFSLHFSLHFVNLVARPSLVVSRLTISSENPDDGRERGGYTAEEKEGEQNGSCRAHSRVVQLDHQNDESAQGKRVNQVRKHTRQSSSFARTNRRRAPRVFVAGRRLNHDFFSRKFANLYSTLKRFHQLVSRMPKPYSLSQSVNDLERIYIEWKV